MEPAACRRRASDAEQSAWAYSVTAECEPVKEEPEWGDCGVSEAAAAEGLYAGHEVKDEVVIGPEVVQKQDVAFSMQTDALNIMEKGPRRPKPEGGTGATPNCTHTNPRDGPRCNMSHKQQLKLRSCSVRLERILVEDLPTCNTCLMIFDCKSSVRNHSCTDSVQEPILCKDACYETAETYFKCDNCGKQYLQKRHLVKHLATHHHVKTGREVLLQHSTNDARMVNTEENSYSDNVSTSISRNQPGLVSHTGDKPCLLKCDICSNMFTRKQDLIKHVTIMHIHNASIKPKLNKCDICQKCFPDQTSLTAHNRSHTSKKPFSCDFCNSQFSHRSNSQFARRRSLAKHVRTHTGKKPFSCDVCKLNFSSRRYLAVHRRTHTGEKPFSCDVCKLRFSQSGNLADHRRTHTGEKPFSCDVCKSRFARSTTLADHRRTHTGEKPFSCDVCKSRFTQRGSLNVHRRTHTGEKPFSCDVCKSQFTLRHHLAAHRRTHTGEKPSSHSCLTNGLHENFI